MTVVAVEEAPAAARAAKAAKAAPRRGGRTQQSGQARTGGRTQQGKGRASTARPKQPPKSKAAPARTTTKRTTTTRQIVYTPARDDKGQGGKPVTANIPDASLPSASAHRWIMAEFLLCVVIVGATPFLQPGGPIGSATKDVSQADQPATSLAGPLVRLTALSALFFILALAGTGPKSGKVAAAFGGLVTLGLLFNALPEVKAAGALFGAKPAKTEAADAGGGGGHGKK